LSPHLYATLVAPTYHPPGRGVIRKMQPFPTYDSLHIPIHTLQKDSSAINSTLPTLRAILRKKKKGGEERAQREPGPTFRLAAIVSETRIAPVHHIDKYAVQLPVKVGLGKPPLKSRVPVNRNPFPKPSHQWTVGGGGHRRIDTKKKTPTNLG